VGDTGMVRHIDDLGRIVIPMELRRSLGIGVKDPIAISVEGDRIVLQKHRDACALCGSTDDTVKVRDRVLCTACVARVKKL
jgi:transcriptional pleiotropic regulator of transition state genes